jgi:hypothetical protein
MSVDKVGDFIICRLILGLLPTEKPGRQGIRKPANAHIETKGLWQYMFRRAIYYPKIIFSYVLCVVLCMNYSLNGRY